MQRYLLLRLLQTENDSPQEGHKRWTTSLPLVPFDRMPGCCLYQAGHLQRTVQMRLQPYLIRQSGAEPRREAPGVPYGVWNQRRRWPAEYWSWMLFTHSDCNGRCKLDKANLPCTHLRLNGKSTYFRIKFIHFELQWRPSWIRVNDHITA